MIDKKYEHYLPLIKQLESGRFKFVNESPIKDGDKVILNCKKIRNRREFSKLQDKYKDFINQHEGDIYTAKIHSYSNTNYPVIIEFEEDSTWLFWSGDLIKVNGEGEINK